MTSLHTASGRMTGSVWNTKDPRGPMRTIVKVGESAGPTLLTLSCGHVGEFANHFTYKVGAETQCFQCGPCAQFRCTSCTWTGPQHELDFYGPHIRCPKCARIAELLTDDRESLQK